MKQSTRTEIQRIIGNRDTEAHPFKGGGAGMEWFTKMIPLVDELSRQEVHEFLLPMLDSLLDKVHDCFSCRAKGLAFGELFCSRQAPELAKNYWKAYQNHLLRRREDRDYRAEVYEAIAKYNEQAPGTQH